MRTASPWPARALVLGLVVTAVLAIAPTAGAEVGCNFTTDQVNVQMTAPGDVAKLEVGGGGTILVDNETGPIICGPGGPPTLTNTENVVIADTSDDPATPAPTDGSTRVEVVEPSAFVPGATLAGENGGLGEIEFTLYFNDGTDDRLKLSGAGPGADVWVVGAGGINWNAGANDPAPDADLVAPSAFDRLSLDPGAGNDHLSAQGGSGTGVALPGDIDGEGADGDDVIEGADLDDDLSGGPGNDVLRGFGGDDFFPQGAGDDTIEGGAGEDELNYYFTAAGVTVDLSVSGPQDTRGGGIDSIAGIEDVYGTDQADQLTGNGAFNYLWGNGGADTLDGGPGDDALTAGDGSDTVTYARAPTGVNINLGTGATSGYGNDGIDGFENVIGSSFADVLVGSDAPNTITGLGGFDTISSLAGPDKVDVRDGGGDVASCGPEADVAIADHHTLDTVDPDCESVSFAQLAAPETLKDKGPKRKLRRARAKFTFSSDSPAATFECKLDGRRFKPCSSPTKTKRLQRHKHTFKVRAVNADGLVDPTPAVWRFKVVKRKR